MASYGALVSLAQTLLQIQHHKSPVRFDKPRLKSLHEHVVCLQQFLEEFPDKADSSLERLIQKTANETEDIVDSILSDQIRSLNSSSSSGHKFKKHYEKLPRVTADMESIVTEIKNRLRNTTDAAAAASATTASATIATASRGHSSSIHVPTGKESTIGFEDELLQIKTRLCSESTKLEVIPIFGMGGIGKTTLARNAYDDPLSRQHFDLRAWVTVSQDYSLKDLLFSLLNAVKGSSKLLDEEKHKNKDVVYKSLKGRRYLIVLDDMWSTKVWDDVKWLFPDDCNSSRIILTTRISGVASYADPCIPLHEMHLMDVNQSWDLLQGKVFKQQYCPPEFEDIGRQIAKSCRGLPLKIVVVAGLLSAVSQTTEAWENIAKNVKLAVAANDDQFDKILSLSYTHLPHHLRLCFLYMAAFPEDHVIHVSRLVKLWLAEGFLKASVSKSFEEVAEEYVEDLVKRSLILVTKKKYNGKIKSCSLHDLVRDMCIRKAEEEKFLRHVMNRNVGQICSGRRRRLSAPTISRALEVNACGPEIRTVLVFQHCVRFSDTLRSFRFLKVLDAGKLYFIDFPDEVLALIHLKYLAFTFSYTDDVFIPGGISHLQNLQTLFIGRKVSRAIIHLPPEIWRMPQLRYIFISVLNGGLPDPLSVSSSASALENLQTLGMVSDFKLEEMVLRMIPNLKKLGIIYWEEQINWGVYHLENLVYLQHLEKLKIHLNAGVYRSNMKSGHLWKELAFPVALKKLEFKGCSFRSRDVATIGALPNLEVLKINWCSFQGYKWETSEGAFPHLKYLQLNRINVKDWITESGHFPTLQHLKLGSCFGLRAIPGDIGEIPTLELIEVDRWDKHLIKSAKEIKKEQESYGNYSLQVLIF